MSDRIELIVNQQRITTFTEYEVDSDLIVPADSFSLTFGPPRGLVLAKGMPCQLKVNDQLVLTGAIDVIDEKDGKSGSVTRVEGRDLMGMVVDQCVEEFIDLTAPELKAAADRLLKKVPLIDRKKITLEKGVAAGTQTRHLQPGSTAFEVLRDLALRRGLLFWCDPDGGFIFAKPKVSGPTEYALLLDPRGPGTNVIDLARRQDGSEEYRIITVLAHGDGDDAAAGGQNNSATVVNDACALRRVKVETLDGDTSTPELRARQLRDLQRSAALRITATVARHSLNGTVWAANKFCAVDNRLRGWKGTYLIYGRTFRLSKEAGQTTEVRLGLPGVLP